MDAKRQTCPNCSTENFIGQCESCGRPFVLSEAFPEGRARQLGDGPLTEMPDGLSPRPCSYCRLRQKGQMMEAMSVGRRQRTCPVCHAECLSGGNLFESGGGLSG